MFGGDFGYGDFFQQIVGALILAGPFVVTEEVWALAGGFHWYQAILLALLVLLIGYSTLYEADEQRSERREIAYLGVPSRFVTLVVVAFVTPALLAFLFGAPTTFNASVTDIIHFISISSLFGVIGAATADSVF